jgi:hypothetical protein
VPAYRIVPGPDTGITVNNYTSESPLLMRECGSGSDLQLWTVEWSGGKAILHSDGNPAWCIDNFGDPTKILGINVCNGANSQKWNVAQLGNGLSMWGTIIGGATTCWATADSTGNAIAQITCRQSDPRPIWRG